MKKIIDMEEVALLEIQLKNAKKRLEEIKEELRNGAKVKNELYASYSVADQNIYGYTEEAQALIDKFIQEQGINKVLLSSKQNYKITFKVTKTAEKKYNKVIQSAIDNAQSENIKKTTSKLKIAM